MSTIRKPFFASSGFANTIIALIGSIIGAWVLSDSNPFPFSEAMEVNSAIESKQFLAIVMAAFTFIYAIRNMIKNYSFGKFKRVIRDSNVWTMLISAITAVFAYFNIGFPEDEAISVVEAVNSGSTEFILIGAYNFLNSLWHIIKKPKPIEQTESL